MDHSISATSFNPTSWPTTPPRCATDYPGLEFGTALSFSNHEPHGGRSKREDATHLVGIAVTNLDSTWASDGMTVLVDACGLPLADLSEEEQPVYFREIAERRALQLQRQARTKQRRADRKAAAAAAAGGAGSSAPGAAGTSASAAAGGASAAAAGARAQQQQQHEAEEEEEGEEDEEEYGHDAEADLPDDLFPTADLYEVCVLFCS